MTTYTQASTFSTHRETARLMDAAAWYDSRRGLNYHLIKNAAQKILGCCAGTNALELGCASGVMTEEFVTRFAHLDVVEAAVPYAERARQILNGKGRVFECLFEEFVPDRKYETIVMTWILEHVADPVQLMSRTREWLEPGGRIYVVVPNAESLHRRVGVHLGLLKSLTELNESDLAIGHRRVYTWDRLTAEITKAGLSLVTMEGILLKPLSSGQMESWHEELRDAFFGIAEAAPQLCSEIFAIAAQ